MFPEHFVAKHVSTFTRKGDYVFDPFCGRGTTVLESLLMGRNAVGSDINPVAFCVTGAKAHVPELNAVLSRINRLQKEFAKLRGDCDRERVSLPVFFRRAYHRKTLGPLLFLRGRLDWARNDIDRFVAALTLGALHGEMDKSSSYLSNQMPRTISTKPRYSVKYWRNNRLTPPERNVFGLLKDRATFRLGDLALKKSGAVALCDARDVGEVFTEYEGKIRLVVTSPPYLNVTRYEEDQWLRLWFLGLESTPTYARVSRDDRHSSSDNYWEFLSEAWEGLGPLVRKGAVLVCRIAGKDVTRKELTENLYETILATFPRAYMTSAPVPSKIRNRQTDRFRPGAKGCFFEMDYQFVLS